MLQARAEGNDGEVRGRLGEKQRVREGREYDGLKGNLIWLTV